MNNKFYGKKTEYLPIREDRTRTIVSYGQESVSDTHCTWYEVYFSKSENPSPSIEQIKDAVIADINTQTDKKILSGFVWTPVGGEPINVWLSAENQRNFSEAQRMAEKYGDRVLPLRFKLGEDAEENPVYHVFETVEELDNFYAEAFAFVNQCLNEGWTRKDSINWSDYEVFFPVTNV